MATPAERMRAHRERARRGLRRLTVESPVSTAPAETVVQRAVAFDVQAPQSALGCVYCARDLSGSLAYSGG